MARLDAYFRTCTSSSSRSFWVDGFEDLGGGVQRRMVELNDVTSESQNQRPEMQVGTPVQYMRSRYASVPVRYRLFLPLPHLALSSDSGTAGGRVTWQGDRLPKLPLDAQMSCLVILLGLFLLADTMCSRDIRKRCVYVHASVCVRVYVRARWKPDI